MPVSLPCQFQIRWTEESGKNSRTGPGSNFSLQHQARQFIFNCQIKTLEIKCLFVLDWPDFFCEINFVWSCWAIKLNCLIKFNWFWLLIVWFGTSEFTTGLHYRRSRKWSHKSTYDSVKVKNRSPKHSRKRDGIGVGRIGTFPFSSYPTYDSIAYDLVRLLESEAEGEG